MVLHGLEGSINIHWSSSGERTTSDTHLAVPFSPRNPQPPLTSILRNTKYCVESFQRRQQDEPKCKFRLKARYKVPEEEALETVSALIDQACQTSQNCDLDRISDGCEDTTVGKATT